MLSRHPPEWASSYVGIPFEVEDCWQLVRRVARQQLDIEMPEFAHKSTDPGDVGPLFDHGMSLYPSTNEADLEVGDLVVFKEFGWIAHIGMVVGINTMLHTRKRLGSSMEPYRCRLREPYRFVRIRSMSPR